MHDKQMSGVIKYARSDSEEKAHLHIYEVWVHEYILFYGFPGCFAGITCYV